MFKKLIILIYKDPFGPLTVYITLNNNSNFNQIKVGTLYHYPRPSLRPGKKGLTLDLILNPQAAPQALAQNLPLKIIDLAIKILNHKQTALNKQFKNCSEKDIKNYIENTEIDESVLVKL